MDGLFDGIIILIGVICFSAIFYFLYKVFFTSLRVPNLEDTGGPQRSAGGVIIYESNRDNSFMEMSHQREPGWAIVHDPRNPHLHNNSNQRGIGVISSQDSFYIVNQNYNPRFGSAHTWVQNSQRVHDDLPPPYPGNSRI